MTDDLKAPERIWAWEQIERGIPSGAGDWMTHQTGGTVEYVRADRIATLEAALADMAQQRDRQYDMNTHLIVKLTKAEAERDAAMAGAVKVRKTVMDLPSLVTGYKDEGDEGTLEWVSREDILAALTSADAITEALSRIEAQAEARGCNNAMLTAITHVAEIRNAHTPGPIFKALNEAMGKIDDARFAGLRRYQTDATEAADKGGA